MTRRYFKSVEPVTGVAGYLCSICGIPLKRGDLYSWRASGTTHERVHRHCDPSEFVEAVRRAVALTARDAEMVRNESIQRYESVLQSAIQDVMTRTAERVGHMAERLRAYKPAQSKGDKVENMFRDSLVENVRDIAALLPGFNLADDPKITALIQRIESTLTVRTPDELREDDNLRHNVASEAERILESVREFLA